MPNHTFAAMRQSIIDGAPDTASSLAQQSLAEDIAPIESINNGYVLGMHNVGEQFARGQMFLPDMMASAEAMRAAMAVLDPELRRLGAERPMAGVVVLGTTKVISTRLGRFSWERCLPRTDSRCTISELMWRARSSQQRRARSRLTLSAYRHCSLRPCVIKEQLWKR